MFINIHIIIIITFLTTPRCPLIFIVCLLDVGYWLVVICYCLLFIILYYIVSNIIFLYLFLCAVLNKEDNYSPHK